MPVPKGVGLLSSHAGVEVAAQGCSWLFSENLLHAVGESHSLFLPTASYPETCGLQIRLTEHLRGVKQWRRKRPHKAGTF